MTAIDGMQKKVYIRLFWARKYVYEMKRKLLKNKKLYIYIYI